MSVTIELDQNKLNFQSLPLSCLIFLIFIIGQILTCVVRRREKQTFSVFKTNTMYKLFFCLIDEKKFYLMVCQYKTKLITQYSSTTTDKVLSHINNFCFSFYGEKSKCFGICSISLQYTLREMENMMIFRHGDVK